MCGNDAVNHSRLRMGLKALQYHRLKYNLINDMHYPLCSHPREDTNHFIFCCPVYATLRFSLPEGLSDLIPRNMFDNTTILENILLFGTKCNEIQYDVKITVCNMFQNYIHVW